MSIGGTTFKLDPNSPECSTPLMKQFIKLKETAGEALLFFRMGDFYELFGQDAIDAAPILGITLTARDKRSDNPVPMAGLPYHSSTNYIQKLLNAGRKVSIAEQMQDPDSVKGIVDRQIIRTFTPAVQFELSGKAEPRYLGTIAPDGKNYILALMEPATGEVKISKPLTLELLLAENALAQIRHFLKFSAKTPYELIESIERGDKALIEEIPYNWISDHDIAAFLQKQYGKMVLHPLLDSAPAQKALALLIQYVLKTQGLETLSHLHEPASLHEHDRLVVGPHTHTHLDSEDLFTLINQTATSMGARTLHGWLQSPFKKVTTIHAQQAAVKELAAESLEAAQIHTNLKEVYDLDRILGRVSTKLAHPRDTYALGSSLKNAFFFTEKLARFRAQNLVTLSDRFIRAEKDLRAICDRILRTQKAEAPLHTRDGGIFELGTDPELDRLIKLTTEGEKFLVDLELREREATGIGSLKVKYNRVFGYFIEISSANLKNVPAHYQRKQTMVGGERFFTEELKKFEEEILTASFKQKALEASLFQKLVDDLNAHAESLKLLSESIGELDALLSLSFLALKASWSFPRIDESFDLRLVDSRHPVVDESLRGQFVSNSVEFSPTTARTLMITGPNMGGKSTIMRQIAQIILLGQMGAPVPAREASWGIFDSLYTRIGAQDAIAKGQSTFMVEMVELAHILSNANNRSFVVLDEIGRGTSTYDGMSVASASLEHLHLKSGARIVFATHYHELTEMETRLPGLRNAHMKVLDEKGKLTFLYELAAGRSSKSFGIQVAELAGLPKPVIKQAWGILKGLESAAALVGNGGTGAGMGFGADTMQMSLFGALAGSNVGMDAADTNEQGPDMDSDIDHDFVDEDSFDVSADQSSASASASLSAMAAASATPTATSTTMAADHPLIAELRALDVNAMTPMQALIQLAKMKEQI
jgi:DNA mismatch repair protein MutS